MVHKSSALAAGTGGSTGGGVVSLQGLSGALNLTSTGNTISITPSGSTIDLEALTGGSGTVTSVSGVTANGFAFSITNPTINPAITAQTTITGVLQGNGTAISAVPNGGISNALLANSAISVNSGTGLTGGGSVALGSAITLALTNTSLTVSGVSGVTGGGTVALGSSITLGMAGNVANTLAGYNNSGVFSDVSIGSNLSLSGGILNGTVGPAPVTSVFGRTGAVVANYGDYAFNQISGVATVSQGGTGVQSLSAHGVLLGEGTANISAATTGIAARILIDQGGIDPSFQSMSGDVSLVSTGVSTVLAVHGVTYGANPSTNTVPVVTSSNVVTYEQVPNAALANSAITIGAQTGLAGGGSVALGSAITMSMGTNSANTLAGYNSSGVFSNVAIGSNLSLSGGTLTATAGSGAVSSVFGRTGAVVAQWNDYQFNLIGGTATASQGGTGLSTLTAHAVLLGEGVSNVSFATTGTAARLLIDQGGVDPAFKSVTGDVSINSAGVTTIQAASVTYAKMQNESAYTVLGNNTGSATSTSAISTLIMGTPGYTPSGYSFEQYTGNTNSYAQISLQNSSAGSSASVDFVLTANDGNDTTHYADFGMNNSVTGGAAFTNPHAAYVYTTDNELDIAALGASGVINFYTTGGVNAPIKAGFFDPSQNLHLTSALSTTFGGTSNTSYTSGQLLVGNSGGTLTPSTISAGTSISITNGSGIVGIAYTGSATGVSTITNSDGSLTISPQTGVVVASLNSAHSNTWSAQQTYSAGVVQTPVALVITASVITTNASLGNYFYVQLVAGTSTLTNPTNPSDSQVITYELQQPSSGSLGLIAVGSAYDYGTSGAVTLTSGASKIDLLGWRYSARNNKWNYLGSQLGF